MKQPAQRGTLQGPAYRESMSIKLDWENQGNEEQRCASKERKLRVSGRTGERYAFEQHKQSEQRWQSKAAGTKPGQHSDKRPG